MIKVTCTEIEIALTGFFDYRKNIIVPNISYGAGLHECDLLIINKSGYATEVEIKISKADLKKDFTKYHNHINPKIKNLYYAIPKDLLSTGIELIPSTAGILLFEKTVSPTNSHISIIRHRLPNPTHDFRAMTEKEIINIGRLAAMRIWNLKREVQSSKNILKEIKDGTRQPDGTRIRTESEL